MANLEDFLKNLARKGGVRPLRGLLDSRLSTLGVEEVYACVGYAAGFNPCPAELLQLYFSLF